MNPIAACWACIIKDPTALRRFHGWATILWIGVTVVTTLVIDGNTAERFLVWVSCYANVMGHWSAWQASRVEVRQEEINDEQEPS